MIIHSHKEHISLQILHWTRNDVVVQCSFTRVCQGVPNKMLGASYTNRDVSPFQTRDLYCNGRNMYVQLLSHLLFVLEMFRSYWTNLYRTVADNIHVNPPSFVRRLRHFGIAENLRPGDENLRHLTVTSI